MTLILLRVGNLATACTRRCARAMTPSICSTALLTARTAVHPADLRGAREARVLATRVFEQRAAHDDSLLPVPKSKCDREFGHRCRTVFRGPLLFSRDFCQRQPD